MRQRKPRRYQPRLPNGDTRNPLLACLPPELAAAVRADARRWNVSASWMVTDKLAEAYELFHLSPFSLRQEKDKAK